MFTDSVLFSCNFGLSAFEKLSEFITFGLIFIAQDIFNGNVKQNGEQMVVVKFAFSEYFVCGIIYSNLVFYAFNIKICDTILDMIEIMIES